MPAEISGQIPQRSPVGGPSRVIIIQPDETLAVGNSKDLEVEQASLTQPQPSSSTSRPARTESSNQHVAWNSSWSGLYRLQQQLFYLTWITDILYLISALVVSGIAGKGTDTMHGTFRGRNPSALQVQLHLAAPPLQYCR